MYSTIPRYVAMCTPVHSDSFPRSLLCHFHPYSDRAPSSPMGGPSVHMKGVKYRVPTVPLTVSRYFPAVPHRVHGLVSIPPLKLEYMSMTIRWIIIGMYPLFRSSVLDIDDSGYLWRLSHRWSADNAGRLSTEESTAPTALCTSRGIKALLVVRVDPRIPRKHSVQSMYPLAGCMYHM